MTKTTRVEGFGMTTLFALGLIIALQEAGSCVQLNNARGHVMTVADEICMRNPNLVQEMINEMEVICE